MKDSTDIDNVRIRFKFDAVENSFNLFHIQSPDLGECLYMKTSRYCKYSRAFHGQTGALWRVIQVKITNAREDDPSVFVFCTKEATTKIFIPGRLNCWMCKRFRRRKITQRRMFISRKSPTSPRS